MKSVVEDILEGKNVRDAVLEAFADVFPDAVATINDDKAEEFTRLYDELSKELDLGPLYDDEMGMMFNVKLSGGKYFICSLDFNSNLVYLMVPKSKYKMRNGQPLNLTQVFDFDIRKIREACKALVEFLKLFV